MKYLLRLSYLGSGFNGFQVQTGSNARTVQGELCRAAYSLFGKDCAVSGCSRTDSGVHALDFAATLETDSKTEISPEKLPRAMNSKLEGDIVVRSAEEVPDGYSVRKHVSGKEYEYIIDNSDYPSPFNEKRAWFYGISKLDEKLMDEAAGKFCGEHDFASFMASGSDVKNTVRRVGFCKVTRTGGIVKINISADGFLYNMVRIITGTLVDVSEGKIKPGDIPDIIAAKNRSAAGRTAPPEGLYLKQVYLCEKEVCDG